MFDLIGIHELTIRLVLVLENLQQSRDEDENDDEEERLLAPKKFISAMRPDAGGYEGLRL